MSDKKSFADSVAENLIRALEAGTAPWQKPWSAGSVEFMPYNPSTGKRYRGINVLNLMVSGRTDPRWLTYKQAQAAGAQVRKGEHGTAVQYWKFTEQQPVLDAQGNPRSGPDGRPLTEEVRLERPKVFTAVVFNGEQIDNLPALAAAPPPAWNPVERAEALLQASQAKIKHIAGDRAYYRPSIDQIVLPERGQFDDSSKYYATALHELGHWTGHPSRLDRDLSHPFGSEGYAREELRAEIASLILGNELGIGHDPGQHAAYVGSWIEILRKDPLEIFRAAADAEKIAGHVIGLEQKQELSQEQAQPLPAQAMNHEAQPDATQRATLTPQMPPAVTVDAALLATARAESNASEYRYDMAQDAQGIVVGGLRALDWRLNRGAFTMADIAADWTKTRDLIRERHGETVTLYRAVDPAEAPNPDSRTVYMADRPMAELYLNPGRQLEAFTVPVTDIVALYARDSGYYEFIIRVPPEGLSAQSDLIAEAARVAEARERENSRVQDPNATVQDREAVAQQRQDTENQAVRKAEQSEGRAGQGTQQADSERLYIAVPYAEKEQAKNLGAKWDRGRQSWFVPPGTSPDPFAKWINSAAAEQQAPPTARAANPPLGRTYLAVPYVERQQARDRGARWDRTRSSWYVPAGVQLDQFVKWLPANVRNEQVPLTPREEFAAVLKEMGLEVSGQHPIMDGKTHRIPATGDKRNAVTGAYSEQSGFYVAHLDGGRPAGYVKNNRTSTETRWKHSGHHMGEEEKRALSAQAEEVQRRREREVEAAHRTVSEQVTATLRALTTSGAALDPTQPEATTRYLSAKGVRPSAGIYRGDHDSTVIPAMDTDGKVWTLQTIGGRGLGETAKSFTKGGRKSGCFHPLGGMAALAEAPAIIIAEGYSTAASLRDGAGFATVCAFDAGNMPAVAAALAAKFPDKPVILAADADSIGRDGQMVTVGREKAQEAADTVGGTVVLPVFRNDTPPGIKPPTDFNDMSQHPEYGPGATRAAIQTALQIAHRQQQEQRQRQEQEQVQEQRESLTLSTGQTHGNGQKLKRAIAR
jgi:putative DNA primase/helicase